MDTYSVAVDATVSWPLASSDAFNGSILHVVLCGGSGTRLWQLSREGLPKQFWPPLSDHSMPQAVVLRATGALEGGGTFDAPLIVCNRQHRTLIASQLNDAGVRDVRIVLEPASRNSVPAVAAAALLAAEQNPNSVLRIMPADAKIGDVDALHRAPSTAVLAAREGFIVTLGMRPTSAEAGFGYVEMGGAVDAVPGAFEVARFVEKPDAETPVILATSGRLLWNSGMFVATAATLLAGFDLHASDVLGHVTKAIDHGRRDLDFIRLDGESFTHCPAISLDYAIAECTGREAVGPTHFAWSDVGDWYAVWNVSPKDARENVVMGDVMLDEADRCLVGADGGLVAVVDLLDAV